MVLRDSLLILRTEDIFDVSYCDLLFIVWFKYRRLEEFITKSLGETMLSCHHAVFCCITTPVSISLSLSLQLDTLLFILLQHVQMAPLHLMLHYDVS